MRRLTCALIVLVLVGAVPARADLAIRIDDVQISQGGEGIINVYVRSTGTDRLSTYNVDYGIAAIGGVGTQLLFASPQPTAYVFDPASNYVFTQPSGLSGTVLPPYTSYADSDTTLAVDGYETIGSADRLLARLVLNASNGNFSPEIGDQFQIDLEFAFTQFFDDAFNEIAYTVERPGTVTIVAAQAVPEPPSAVLACLALVFGAHLRTLRFKVVRGK